MQNCIVVFDTNSYRDFVENLPNKDLYSTMDIILKLEKNKNIIGCLHPIVLIELFSHLSNQNNDTFNICKEAIKLAYTHCMFLNKNEIEDFRILMDSEFELCNLLFKYQSSGHKNDIINLGKWANIVYKENEGNYKDFKKFCESIADYVKEEEERFVANVKNKIIKPIDPNCSDWKPLKDDHKKRKLVLEFINSNKFDDIIALSQVLKAIEICGIDDPSENEIDSLTNIVKNYFQAPIELYREIIKRLFETGMDFSSKKRKRENYIWDFHILFNVTLATSNGKQLYLVTTDRDMNKAAKRTSEANKIITLKEYLSSIGLGKELIKKITSQ